MTTTRPLTPAEADALAAARLLALEHTPYLAHALFAVSPVAAPGLGTMAVDKHWRLYLDPATTAQWGPAITAGVLVHEVSHLIREHAARAEDLPGKRDHRRWNYATDAAINDDLVGVVPLPEGVITPEALGLPAAGIEEVYYAALAPTPPEDSDDNAGDTGCGSGAGDPVADYELDATDPAAAALSPAQATITRRQVANTIRSHASTTRGTVPAGIVEWAERHLAAPTVPWRTVLAATVRRAVAHARGAHDYTYTRPGRRRLPGIITPAMRRPLLTVAVVLDTSGSMSNQMIDAALSEVTGVLTATGVARDNVHVLSCDAAVAATTRVRKATDVKVAGRGGTDMRVGITAAQALQPSPDVIVVLTDGYTPWPEHPTRARLVIALIGTSLGADQCPPWARVVTVPTTDA